MSRPPRRSPPPPLRSAGRDRAHTAILEGGSGHCITDPRRVEHVPRRAPRRRSAAILEASSNLAKTAARSTLNRSRNAATRTPLRVLGRSAVRVELCGKDVPSRTTLNRPAGRVDGVEDDAQRFRPRSPRFHTGVDRPPRPAAQH